LQITLYLFWLAAFIDLAGEWFGIVELRYASKPLLMIFLGVWYFQSTASGRTVTHKLLLVAFAFSWAGDVFLMNKNEIFFLLGLVSFLITHILYILGFRKEIILVPGKSLLRRNPLVAIPVLLLFAGLLMLVFNRIEPEMKIPVVVYASVITTMVTVALNRYGKVSAKSFQLVSSGALLFMLSDSLIALNKFYFGDGLWKASFWIMLLYIVGQYLIARGTVKTAEP